MASNKKNYSGLEQTQGFCHCRI